jgi:hypothetical protein
MLFLTFLGNLRKCWSRSRIALRLRLHQNDAASWGSGPAIGTAPQNETWGAFNVFYLTECKSITSLSCINQFYSFLAILGSSDKVNKKDSFLKDRITLRVLLEYPDKSTFPPPSPVCFSVFGRGHCELSHQISRLV